MNMNFITIDVSDLSLTFANEYEYILDAFDDNSYATQIQKIGELIDGYSKDFINKKINDEELKFKVNKQIDKIFEVFALKLVEHFEANITKFEEYAYKFLENIDVIKNEYKEGKYGIIGLTEAYEKCSNLSLNFQLELELKENSKKEKKNKI